MDCEQVRLDETRTSHTWMEDAACRHVVDPGIFDDVATEKTAKAVCRTCPVLADCFSYIHGLADFTGIAAGTVWRNGHHPPVPSTPCESGRSGGNCRPSSLISRARR
ncbi:WhiB family transcriptional regulator [Streptomyces fumanus]|uniref:4Fe-4S Wbl-type domain-containing protein n=1 Tax=Streptomyces fumanus TaxID=67302 RepID=A0A919DYY3_9ACTN|nr:WhiB family transcriptional regulator [Streptomyces fumanus]GHE99797.1 hypothetical protein GCM10018772_25320 [Streptomyces fumanus]